MRIGAKFNLSHIFLNNIKLGQDEDLYFLLAKNVAYIGFSLNDMFFEKSRQISMLENDKILFCLLFFWNWFIVYVCYIKI